MRVIENFMRNIVLVFTLLLTLLSYAKLGYAKQVDRMLISESAEQVSPLLNGQLVPKVDVTQLDGKQVNLQSILANKKTILFFYRGGWCPFCNTQMGQLQQLESQLVDLGFQLIGISTDSVTDLQQSISERNLSYQLLSDHPSKVSTAFGLSFFTSKMVTDRYLAKLDLKNPLRRNAAGEERLVLPVPAIYVFDSQGMVQFNYVNANFRVRLAPELLLQAAKLVK